MAAIHASAAARLVTSSPSAIVATSSRSESGPLSRSPFFSGSSRSLVLSAESPFSAARPASTSSQPASFGLAPCKARRLSVSAQAAGSDAAKVSGSRRMVSQRVERCVFTPSQPAWFGFGLVPCNARRLTVSAQATGSDAAKPGDWLATARLPFSPYPSQISVVEAYQGEQVKVLTRSVDRAKEVFAAPLPSRPSFPSLIAPTLYSSHHLSVTEGVEMVGLEGWAAAVAGSTEGVELVGPEGWAAAVAGSGSVVNLAGTPISTRWSPAIKAEIISSRVDTTAKIVEAINSLPKDKRPSVLVNTSAVGFYGTSETATYDESSPAGNDFLAEVCTKWEAEVQKVCTKWEAEVCTKWEAEAQKVSPDSTRLAIIRFGVVLDKGGGALGKMLPIFQLFAGGPLGTGQQWAGGRDKGGGVLGKMLPIFQLFAGGPLGTGQQWMSWVHRDDLVALIIETLRNKEFTGVLNGTAPSPARMAQFCEALGSAIGRPSWLPVPNFAVQTLLGEGAMVVLDGQRVLPKRTESLGFRFKYRNIQNALAAIFS
ncbi:unnamed protein product [Closterium sp. NIES-65]|nr:unnamed protein product [Closterium sp. NIES-65]